MNRFIVYFAIFCVAASNAESFKCPNDKRGQFADPIQCDKYYECVDGKVTEKLCADGLVFDETIRLINKCDQPFNVDCGDRLELQEAKSKNEKCPRKNGFFAHPNPAVCNIFYNCIDDDAIEMTCTNGLHFDEYTGTCVWPDTINREGCKTAEELSNTENKDEFKCPKQSIKTADTKGQTIAHPRFQHETDCQKFYVCLNGIEKRVLTCEPKLVYSSTSQQCEEAENVPGCEDWYKEDAEEQRK